MLLRRGSLLLREKLRLRSPCRPQAWTSPPRLGRSLETQGLGLQFLDLCSSGLNVPSDSVKQMVVQEVWAGTGDDMSLKSSHGGARPP